MDVRHLKFAAAPRSGYQITEIYMKVIVRLARCKAVRPDEHFRPERLGDARITLDGFLGIEPRVADAVEIGRRGPHVRIGPPRETVCWRAVTAIHSHTHGPIHA